MADRQKDGNSEVGCIDLECRALIYFIYIYSIYCIYLWYLLLFYHIPHSKHLEFMNAISGDTKDIHGSKISRNRVLYLISVSINMQTLITLLLYFNKELQNFLRKSGFTVLNNLLVTITIDQHKFALQVVA